MLFVCCLGAHVVMSIKAKYLNPASAFLAEHSSTEKCQKFFGRLNQSSNQMHSILNSFLRFVYSQLDLFGEVFFREG